MKIVAVLFTLISLLCSIVVAIYFIVLLKRSSKSKNAVIKDGSRDQEKLNNMRRVFLTAPLSEATRPSTFEEIIGQDRGLKALKAALCGPNPQHVLIYGEPGIGKTAAARISLNYAKTVYNSPFTHEAKFVEIDGTTLRFDERGVADPLIGSVHDPIYQGAGAYGSAGIPQPKMGAVSKAHGGILFIDEIGEMHSSQMNKLLKVLEDRKVFFESSYYKEGDNNIPSHIHDIFQNGLPADFRLVGATTRQPSQLTPALRSRCMEIFFDSLGREDIKRITLNALEKIMFNYEEGVDNIVVDYASNGRDAVNMIQTAGSIVSLEKRNTITIKDIEWVIETGRYQPRLYKRVTPDLRVGVVNAIGVQGIKGGHLLEIEVVCYPVISQKGKLTITGIIDEEEIHGDSTSSKRTSSARASVNNALTLLESLIGISWKDYNIHINYPGGYPVDGPSAGIAIFAALYSAILKKPISSELAMTGEIGVLGKVYPVGGIHSKITAAKFAGVKKVIIPASNKQSNFNDLDIEVVGISRVEELLQIIFNEDVDDIKLKARDLLNA